MSNTLLFSLLQIVDRAAPDSTNRGTGILTSDPESSGFLTLMIISEIGVTLIVFYGFYLIFNRFNKKMKLNKKENPELTRKD